MHLKSNVSMALVPSFVDANASASASVANGP
jgi:hypothetical protein